MRRSRRRQLSVKTGLEELSGLETKRQVRAVARMIDLAVLDERRRLASLLHDSLGAMLFGIGAAVRRLRTDHDGAPDLAQPLARVEDQARAALAALRRVLLNLTDVPSELRLEAALQSECSAFEERTGLPSPLIDGQGIDTLALDLEDGDEVDETPVPGLGLGLGSVRERLERVGGHLALTQNERQGVTLRAWVSRSV